MTRIDEDIDWIELHSLAEAAGITPIYRRARCQHGHTRDELCVSCEGGYVDDTHSFANCGEIGRDQHTRQLAATSHDGEDVAYIPARYEARARKTIAAWDAEQK